MSLRGPGSRTVDGDGRSAPETPRSRPCRSSSTSENPLDAARPDEISGRQRLADTNPQPRPTRTRRGRIPDTSDSAWWTAAIIARANGEAPPPRFPHRIDVAVSAELRTAIRKAARGTRPPLEPDAWLALRTSRLVREILRAALGLPTMDGGRTLDRLAAWTGEREAAARDGSNA